MRRSLVLLVLMAACPVVFAQAYKWKDADGTTHYSDTPPPGKVRAEQVKISTNAAAPAPAPTPAPAAAATAAANAAPAGTADTPANRKALCEQVRKNMAILTKEATVTMDDGKGGTRPVDDATRAAELKKAQAQQTLYCGA